MPTPFVAPRCPGTVASDPNGNRIVPEVLNNPSAYDLNLSTPNVEYACVLDNAQQRQALPAPSGALDKMQVCQTILFWGDIRFARQ